MDDLRKIKPHNKDYLMQLEMPESAIKLIEILDKLEYFTILIRKKITDEVKINSKLIHLKLDVI